jgi:hypothetical protein
MKVKIQQAIEMAKNNKSLKGLVIEDLNDTQVDVVDAIALARQGIMIPEVNIYYDDEKIAYDPDFDDFEWSKQPIKMTWEEKFKLAESITKNEVPDEEISVKIRVSDRKIHQWVSENFDKMGPILSNFIVDIYKANTIINGTIATNDPAS